MKDIVSEGEFLRGKLPAKWPIALAEIYDATSCALKNAGYDQEASQTITGIVVRALSFIAGGRQIYIPRGGVLERWIRNAQIYREFTGGNVQDLSRKYRLTEVQIYAILKEQRAAAKQDWVPVADAKSPAFKPTAF